MKEEVERTRRWRRERRVRTGRGRGREEEKRGIKDERIEVFKASAKKILYHFLCFSYRARVLILLCFIILKSFLKCPFRKRITKSKNGIQVFTLFKMTYIKKNLRSEYFFRTYSLVESTVWFYGTHCKKNSDKEWGVDLMDSRMSWKESSVWFQSP